MRNFIKYNIQNVKGSKRPSSLIDRDNQQSKKSPQKIVNNYHQASIQNKLQKLQQQLHSMYDHPTQSMILQQLSEIKDDIRMIKSHIFQINRHNKSNQYANTKQKTNSSNYEEQENAYTMNNIRLKSHSEQDHHRFNVHSSQNSQKKYRLEQILNQKNKRASSTYNKNAVSLKNIYPLLKDYKLEGPQFGTIFYGYAKRNSQPVAIKYSEDSLTHIIEIYDRLWKNIAKAKWPCINRIYDYKSDENNVLIMEKNKSFIVGLPYINVILDILKVLQFIHDCGYLYRNIQPQHFMLNEEDQLVIIDFKRAKRYIDIKGHQIQVIQSQFTGSPFASNNQVRGISECRKDDLQSLGYLALLLFEMQIPWAGMNKQQTIRTRSNLTLQSLFNQNNKWVQYMAVVMKTSKNQRPDYRRLYDIIST